MREIFDLTNNNSWETPIEIFLEGCRKFKCKPTLDVCATKDNKKCDKYFTEKDDGLNQEWLEDSFVNPPYNNTKMWIKKAYEQNQKHNIDVLALIFARTDTTYWHDYIEGKAQVSFIKGRLRFLQNGKMAGNYAPFPSVWIFWKKRYEI